MARSELVRAAGPAALLALAGCDLVVGIDTQAEPCELGSFATATPVERAEIEDFSADWDLRFAVVMSKGSAYELDLSTEELTPIDLGPYSNFGLALVPEGNALFYTIVTEPYVLKGALRGDAWLLDAEVPRAAYAGTPSADVFGPRRLMVRERAESDLIQEYEDVSGRWTPVGEPHAIPAGRVPNLTPNGLTMVYAGTDAQGNPAIMAAQRRTTAEWFDDPTVLLAGTFWSAQLLGECKRLYAGDGMTLRQYDR
jgi:hypothetical protein